LFLEFNYYSKPT